MDRETSLLLAGQVVEQELGLYFPPERSADLARALSAAANEFGFPDELAFIVWLTENQLSRFQIEKLALHLTVGETFFFRDKEVFAALENEILPELIFERRKTGKRLNLWSAGCSSGEEAFSLGILLQRLLPDLYDWQITILASDINKRQLEKAAKAEYGEWSFRDAPAWLKEKYFQQHGNTFSLADSIRRMVKFFPFNLRQDLYPDVEKGIAELDIVFCRNVLMYFSQQQAQTVIKKMQRCIVDGGWIVTNPVESAAEVRACFSGESKYSPALRRKCKAEKSCSYSGATSAESLDEARAKAVFNAEPERECRNEAAELAIQKEINGEIRSKVRRLADQGQLEEALACCRTALEKNSLNLELQYLTAMILLETKRFEEAVLALQRVIYIEPDFILAHFYLGCIYQQQACFSEEKRLFGNVRRLLQQRRPDEEVEEGDGFNAAGLLRIVDELLQSEKDG